jgi:hypothetical protein
MTASMIKVAASDQRTERRGQDFRPRPGPTGGAGTFSRLGQEDPASRFGMMCAPVHVNRQPKLARDIALDEKCEFLQNRL